MSDVKEPLFVEQIIFPREKWKKKDEWKFGSKQVKEGHMFDATCQTLTAL